MLQRLHDLRIDAWCVPIISIDSGQTKAFDVSAIILKITTNRQPKKLIDIVIMLGELTLE
jgi:hypothetical protein